MPGDKRHAALRRCVLFAEVSEDSLAHLAAAMSVRRYQRGQIVFAEGEPGDSLYVVLEGVVQVLRHSEQGTELLLTTIGSGEALGELAVLDGGTRSATAQTLGPCVLGRLDRAVVLRLVETDPAVARALLLGLVTLVRRLTGSASDLVFLDLPRRVAKFLLTEPRHGDLLELPLTQGQVASRLGGARQSVNTALKDFERRGWIRASARSVRIIDERALRRFAEH